MADIAIHNLDADVISRLQEHATTHGRSLEAEVKFILTEAAHPPSTAAWAGVDAIWQQLASSDRRFGDSAELVREDRQR
jgi:antitoxin FitA